VQADIYVWRYALLVVYARKEENSACKFVFSVRLSTAALRLSAGGLNFDRTGATIVVRTARFSAGYSGNNRPIDVV